MADTREKALQDYRKKLLEHKEVDGRLKECTTIFDVDVSGGHRNMNCLCWLGTLLDIYYLLAVQLLCALSCS